jgi:hypothetical protein
MDLNKAIRELYEEKKLLDQVIVSLETLLEVEQSKDAATGAKRRGRKGMSEEERLEVSKRMKEYWAARRKGAAKKKPASSPKP